MPQFEIVSPSEQVARYLRDGLTRGRWSGLMPGAPRLAEELGADRKTVEAGLCLLEQEGLLVAQGAGRRRKIMRPDKMPSPSLRVAILLGDGADRGKNYILEIEHTLAQAGHTVIFPAKSMEDLGMDVRRIARMVAGHEADAWVVVSGSLEILEWFAERETPAFALFGRRPNVRLASVGPDKVPAFLVATRQLIHLGHQRIVLLVRQMRRLPTPGLPEQAFLGELVAKGVTLGGPYHLPDWEESVDGFHTRLHALFDAIPPTAMIIDEVAHFLATQQFLAARGLKVPGDVSLVCTDSSPDFNWCRPTVAHIRWDTTPVVRRVARWVANVSRGTEDLQSTNTPAEFVPGGTIGPVG